MGSIRRITETLAALIGVLLVGLILGPGSAAAAVPGTTFDDVGRALRGDPLYVDPKSEVTLTSSEQQEIRSAIDSAGTPIFIAVLPQKALDSGGGTPNAVIERLRSATGLQGAYAIMLGTSNSSYGFQARSTEGSVGAVADQAYDQNRGDPAGTLVQFTDSVAQLAANGQMFGGSTIPGPSGITPDTASATGSSGVTGVGALAVLGGALLVSGAAAVGLVAHNRKKSRAREAVAVEAVRRTLDEDITAF
ncbi:MAG: hypothetical protein RLZ55_1463, partial [Actinomycetota bacterium]